jgi:hypothetical protein
MAAGAHFLSLALGPHPQRELTLMLAFGLHGLTLAWPQALIFNWRRSG